MVPKYFDVAVCHTSPFRTEPEKSSSSVLHVIFFKLQYNLEHYGYIYKHKRFHSYKYKSKSIFLSTSFRKLKYFTLSWNQSELLCVAPKY